MEATVRENWKGRSWGLCSGMLWWGTHWPGFDVGVGASPPAPRLRFHGAGRGTKCSWWCVVVRAGKFGRRRFPNDSAGRCTIAHRSLLSTPTASTTAPPARSPKSQVEGPKSLVGPASVSLEQYSPRRRSQPGGILPRREGNRVVTSTRSRLATPNVSPSDPTLGRWINASAAG